LIVLKKIAGQACPPEEFTSNLVAELEIIFEGHHGGPEKFVTSQVLPNGNGLQVLVNLVGFLQPLQLVWKKWISD
jgi:hypothetical protein